MRDTPVGIYTVGQTPRPDLTESLARRLPSCRFELRGAIDGLGPRQIAACRPAGYPLETRLQDGTRIVADAEFLQPRLQASISELDADVRAHLVLCAGPFPLLTARRPIFRPFDIAAGEMLARGHRSLELLVPFAAQAGPAAGKWEAVGLSCRVHTLTDAPEERPVADWLGDRLAGTPADAIMFDYVGFPAAILDALRKQTGTPVFDAGDLALDELARSMER
jgi:protein AroM